MELVHIAANKNTVPGDVSAMVPGGIRMGKSPSPLIILYVLVLYYFIASYFAIVSYSLFGDSGTPALTSRGFTEEDFVKVAEFFDAAVKLALKIKADTKGS